VIRGHFKSHGGVVGIEAYRSDSRQTAKVRIWFGLRLKEGLNS